MLGNNSEKIYMVLDCIEPLAFPITEIPYDLFVYCIHFTGDGTGPENNNDGIHILTTLLHTRYFSEDSLSKSAHHLYEIKNGGTRSYSDWFKAT